MNCNPSLVTRGSSAAALTPAARRYLYRPYGAARELFACRDLEVLMEGPAGTGKSRALLEKMNLLAMRYPGTRALMVRKTRASMTESTLVTFEEKVIPAGWPLLEGPRRAHRLAYRYPNGSAAVVGGMDRPSKIMSTEFDLVLAFEARELTEEDWESLLARLRNGRTPYPQAIADTNPDAPSHWLNQRAGRGRMIRLCSRHTDNPAVDPAYLEQLDRLSGVRKLRLRDGRWAAAENLVYEDWDPRLHLCPRTDDAGRPHPALNDPSWRRIRSIDFGYTHPFVCQWWAIDGDGRMFLYREHYRTRGLVEDHARRILELSRGEVIEATVSDHAAAERATLERQGIATLPAYKAIGPGIQAVARRLAPAGDGRPRLQVLEDALVERDPRLVEAGLPLSAVQEFEHYAWPTSPTADGEHPLDRHNHALDALRYAVAYVDGLGTGPLEVKVI